MNLKRMLKVSTSLMVVCAGFVSSFAQAEDYVAQSQINTANGVAGLNASKQVTADVNNSRVATDAVQLNKNNAIQQSQVNVASGIAGLNASKEVTANINSKQVYTPFMMLPNTGALRFNTNSSDANNTDLNIFYNRDSKVDGWNNKLEGNTLYFTNNHYGNNYKFVGNVGVTGNLTAKNLHIQLSTPSSSSAACSAGDIKDDINYHYVCVDTNKWKRVALSDF